MVRHIRKHKCKHCQTFFDPDPRNVGRQHSCSQPPCRQASKAASQRRWLHKPANCDYFSGPAHVERVRQWRKGHPGYWRRQAPMASQSSATLQEPFVPQALETQQVEQRVEQEALQDSFFMQPTVLVGLIAHLTGLSLQDDIALTARRLQQLGRDILNAFPHNQGGSQRAKAPHLFTQASQSAQAVQLGGSALRP
jgi:hypothetical protein